MHLVDCGDCLELMKKLGNNTVDLVFTSPPYEDARTYGIDFTVKGQEWVNWCADRYMECLRVSKGLVAWVVEGRTRDFKYSNTPAMLMCELQRRGAKLRKPPIFHRVGIPGSGGPDWLRNDYEFCVCATREGRLPWSDNTAMGHPPKYGCFGGHTPAGYSDGDVRHLKKAGGPYSYRQQDGDRVYNKQNKPYAKANPGNVLPTDAMAESMEAGHVIRGSVGGGKLGSPIAHENEAPFPLWLAEFFVRSFCPPGGVVLDPFAGSGTVAHAAINSGRNSISIDVRESQVELTKRRITEASTREEIVAP